MPAPHRAETGPPSSFRIAAWRVPVIARRGVSSPSTCMCRSYGLRLDSSQTPKRRFRAYDSYSAANPSRAWTSLSCRPSPHLPTSHATDPPLAHNLPSPTGNPWISSSPLNQTEQKRTTRVSSSSSCSPSGA